MNLNGILNCIADFLEWTFGIFEVIGNSFNYFVIVLGFIGLFSWLRLQTKYNRQAASNPNQIK